MYHPPSQSSNTFKDFVDNFELNLDKVRNKNPYLFLVLSDFNVKSSNRYKLDKKTYGGFKIDEVTSQFRLQQLIKEPTHILAGVYFPLHENFNHQMRYTNINLIVCYLPSYECEIWNYQRSNVGPIQRAIEQFSQKKLFRNLNINEMASLFNRNIKDNFSSYILHETIHLGLITT